MSTIADDTAEQASRPWREPANGLTEASLRALIAGDIPAIRIPDFASSAECERLCQAIRRAPAKGDTAVTSPMNLIGCNFSNHGADGKENYFARVAPSYREVTAITSEAGFDPLRRMLERLHNVWPGTVTIAEDPQYGRYFAGGIKTRTQGSRVHYDYAPHTAPGHVIAQVADQLGWNLYLALPANTGQTTTYNRPIPRGDGARGSGNALSLALDPRWVSGAEAYTFRPREGEVVMINTRYPHEVVMEDVAPEEWRVQASSFIGRLETDELILWS